MSQSLEVPGSHFHSLVMTSGQQVWPLAPEGPCCTPKEEYILPALPHAADRPQDSSILPKQRNTGGGYSLKVSIFPAMLGQTSPEGIL